MKKNKKQKETFNVKKFEMYAGIVVAFILILLLVATIKKIFFLPAFLIAGSLELFIISYYYINDLKKKNIVFSTFIIGVILLFSAILYFIVKIS